MKKTENTFNDFGISQDHEISISDGFPQNICGTWHRSVPPIKAERMEFQLLGQWDPSAKMIQTATLFGKGSINGLISNSQIYGTLEVTLVTVKCKIRLYFSDPHGIRYNINAAISSIAGGAFGKRMIGTLTQGENFIGKVELEIDWAPLKEATESLGKEVSLKIINSFKSMLIDRNADEK